MLPTLRRVGARVLRLPPPSAPPPLCGAAGRPRVAASWHCPWRQGARVCRYATASGEPEPGKSQVGSKRGRRRATRSTPPAGAAAAGAAPAPEPDEEECAAAAQQDTPVPGSEIVIFSADKQKLIRPLSAVSLLQAGAWGLLLVNGPSLPLWSAALTTVGSFGFPTFLAVYASHYVCELTILRPSLRDRSRDVIRVMAHTFSGGYKEVSTHAIIRCFRLWVYPDRLRVIWGH